jgi:hypothetical protein
MSDMNLNCTDCDDLFLDYFEGDLDARRRAQVDAHVAQCARCQGIVRDFEMIQREAKALSDIAPSRDLWSGIESRIASPVVAIATRRERAPMSRRMMGLAAAALVIVSSSVTWLATRSTMTDRGTVRIASNPGDVPDLNASNEVPPSAPGVVAEPAPQNSPTEAAAPVTTPKSSGSSPSESAPSVRRPSVTLKSAGTSLASTKSAPTASELALAPEIAALQITLRQRRSQLDPETVKVVEDNLKLIDLALEQAKAALRKDPESGFLNEQLDGALQKKVELLRTVALLPSRT